MNSQSILTSQNERSMLKNLGVLIGKLTLARNRPLLWKDICLKMLLVHSYESGKMFVVLPFVTKILDCVGESKFTPNNAWVMAHLRLLVEIYRTPNLKLNLKFEVEVLCTSLGVSMDDIQPTTLLKVFFFFLFFFSSFFLFFSRLFLPLLSYYFFINSYSLPPKKQGLLQPTIDNQDIHLPKGEQGPIINPSIYLFSQYPKLKKHIQTAIDTAIREILSHIVERSVSISCITTREMTLKDFGGGEGDQARLRGAAHSMVQYLSGSLASVTCRYVFYFYFIIIIFYFYFRFYFIFYIYIYLFLFAFFLFSLFFFFLVNLFV